MSTHILVVDDEPDVESMFRQHFRRDLRSGRFIMEFALSAPAALERIKAIADPSLILILSDINMPGMSGLEMLPKVRAERPNVPVIMITAYGDENTRRHAIAQGAVGLLTKPIDFALLRQEIARAGPWRPGFPVEGDHRFRWMTTTCSGRWRPGQQGCGRA